jgi:hypothetical protein
LFAADAVGLQSTAELWWQSSPKRLELRCRPCLRLRRGFASPKSICRYRLGNANFQFQFRTGPAKIPGVCSSKILDLKIEILLRNVRFGATSSRAPQPSFPQSAQGRVANDSNTDLSKGSILLPRCSPSLPPFERSRFAADAFACRVYRHARRRRNFSLEERMAPEER